MEILPGEISFNKGAYKCYTEFISDFEKYGGIQRSRGSALRATSSRRRADWSLICASLENLSGSVGSELRERQHVGCFSPDVITFVDTDSNRNIWKKVFLRISGQIKVTSFYSSFEEGGFF
ncbi:uncharacterized protein LOC107221728 isoform X3 [Neodiprion lecontei]|uniref:Uncharacterized protein LOC107221728 isoform X3 n=1 Tax=Neodiprion lecontei TaxID=441921 RepID=A0ABM3G0T3_NEOLC|nr:uncharacterized protein LOC107221728 isoform X3 [Neodiprion lecontei]